MKKANSFKHFKLALLGAALAVSGAAAAAGAGGSERFHDRVGHACHHQGHHAHHGFYKHHSHGFHHSGKGMRGHGHAQQHRAGLIVPGYGMVSRDFVDGMGLNDEQQKLIEEARKAGKDLRDSRRDRIKAEREARNDRYKADTFDPEQALKQRDEQRENMQAERRQIDQKWIAVWKSLDAGQQARVADHLKQRAEKTRQRIEKFEERKQQRENAKSERGDRKQRADTNA